jgi:hypothetical protein
MENETRSQRAKRMREEGRFVPRNPGRPRKRRDDDEIVRRSLLEVVQTGTPRQRLDATRQLRALDERRGSPRPDFGSMGEAEIVAHFEGMVGRAVDHWGSARLLPQFERLFAGTDLEGIVERVVERKLAERDAAPS